jgi:hypothetical protein
VSSGRMQHAEYKHTNSSASCSSVSFLRLWCLHGPATARLCPTVLACHHVSASSLQGCPCVFRCFNTVLRKLVACLVDREGEQPAGQGSAWPSQRQTQGLCSM